MWDNIWDRIWDPIRVFVPLLVLVLVLVFVLPLLVLPRLQSHGGRFVKNMMNEKKTTECVFDHNLLEVWYG